MTQTPTTTQITFRSDFDVELIDTMGSDHRIVQAAKVSTLGKESLESSESANLIKYLMNQKHGSPFESSIMQWMIFAPIFVWREFHRHRIASYNEQSSRWTQLAPIFYVPDPLTRPMFKTEGSRTGDYSNRIATNTEEQITAKEYTQAIRDTQRTSYERYQRAILRGVAKEVSRQLLPVSIYSTCYVTMNVRALMNFLSLRNAPEALYEIRQVANSMETQFQQNFPQTHQAFLDAGRIAP